MVAFDQDHGTPSIEMLHGPVVMHCLHVLLQELLCNVDVGIILHNWDAHTRQT
jgi:hypothetical protein